MYGLIPINKIPDKTKPLSFIECVEELTGITGDIEKAAKSRRIRRFPE